MNINFIIQNHFFIKRIFLLKFPCIYIKIVYILFFVLFSLSINAQTYRDNFNTVAGNNSNGTGSWNTSWVEVGDGGSVANGQILIITLLGQGSLYFIEITDQSISRALNLSSATSVTLTLDYTRSLLSNKTLSVELYDGTIYNTRMTLNGTGSQSYTLAPNEISGLSAIGFINGNGPSSAFLPAETITVDNVMFTINPDNDGDGIQDTIDLDDDNDGILDSAEGVGDFDGDGIVNGFDLDSDNDGIYDVIEAGHNISHTNGRLIGAVGTDGIPNSVQASGQQNSGTINYTVANNDMHGNSDFLDLDSDNDGCNDVIEAGFTDADSNGLLGNGTFGAGLTVNGNGLVTSGTDGYTTPNDNDGNTVSDYLQAGSAPTISVQPFNFVGYDGDNIYFTITSTADNFQWQESTNGGGTFNDIVNGGIYSGTQTNTLNINPLELSFNNYQYQVIVSNSNYICGNIVSSSAILFTRVKTVITNRRITARVNK